MDEALKAISAEGFVFGRQALLSTSSAAGDEQAPTGEGAAGTVEVKSYRPGRVVLIRDDRLEIRLAIHTWR